MESLAQPAESPHKLTRDDFFELACYLSVSFADEESGDILMSVTEDETGEVLNPLFEGRDIAIFTAIWS